MSTRSRHQPKKDPVAGAELQQRDTPKLRPANRDKRSPSPSLFPKISLPALEKKIEKIVSFAWSSLPFDSLPEWLRDNEFLHHNHRPPMYSFRGCAKSLFRLHTETWNIWTHLLGALFFIVLVAGVYVFGDYITFLFADIQIHNLPWEEQASILCFFSGAVLCLACSTIFHWFSNHSEGVYSFLCKLDYTGISFLITGSMIPAYYYGFYCTVIAKYIHIFITLALCILCVCVSMWNKFSAPKYRPLRFGVFVLFGLYGSIPFIHIFIRDGYVLSVKAYSLWGFVSMAAVYLTGALVYVTRFPERFMPGKFDIWASSHQLWHVCVVTAALVYYDALLNMVKYRLDVGTCIPFEMLTMSAV